MVSCLTVAAYVCLVHVIVCTFAVSQVSDFSLLVRYVAALIRVEL